MAIPWLVVLQSVPWSDVIKGAPKIAEGAKKLWSAVSKKQSLADNKTSAASQAEHAPGSIEMLQQRLDKAEASIADLQAQMLASSELIKSLADQNAGLIKRAEVMRLRIIWLFIALLIVVGFLGMEFY